MLREAFAMIYLVFFRLLLATVSMASATSRWSSFPGLSSLRLARDRWNECDFRGLGEIRRLGFYRDQWRSKADLCCRISCFQIMKGATVTKEEIPTSSNVSGTKDQESCCRKFDWIESDW